MRDVGSRQDVLITEVAVGPMESDEELDACAANKKAKKKRVGQKKKDGVPKRGGDKVRWANIDWLETSHGTA